MHCLPATSLSAFSDTLSRWPTESDAFMAARSPAPIAIGDKVTIIPHKVNGRHAKAQRSSVVYAGPDYIRLSDNSAYTTLGLKEISGWDGFLMRNANRG